MMGGFLWAGGCGSSDDDDGGADTTSGTASNGNGGSSTSAGSGNTDASNGNSQSNNSGTGTTGDVLMHDDSACEDQNPVDRLLPNSLPASFSETAD
jgi:hypothetical protein